MRMAALQGCNRAPSGRNWIGSEELVGRRRASNMKSQDDRLLLAGVPRMLRRPWIGKRHTGSNRLHTKPSWNKVLLIEVMNQVRKSGAPGSRLRVQKWVDRSSSDPPGSPTCDCDRPGLEPF
jgi:hypothetical protein